MSSTTTDPAGSAGGVVLRWLDATSDTDVALWRDVRLAMLLDTPGAFGSRYADHLGLGLERWRENVASPVMSTLVAVEGGAPVGAARLMEGGDDLPELISMFVAPAHRGTGLSSRIVEAVADCARGRGHAALHLHVMTDNPRARGVYERGGFRCVGAPFRAAPDDPDDLRTEWRMERPLRGAGAGMES